jgi:chromosomal replication initiator protein
VWCKFSQQELCLTEIKSRFYDTSADSFDGINDLVISTVAEFYDLTSEQLKSPCRRQTTVLARGLALSLIRHLCPLSLTSLGQLFGNRDHSTILSALQTTERRVQTDQTVRSALVELFERLKSKATVQRITLSKTELNVDLMFSDEEL